MQAKDKKLKGQLMFVHKSVGLTLLVVTAVRLGYRGRAMLQKTIPPHMPNPRPLKLASDAAHVGLYFFMVMLPVSGVAMGYFGGRG
jgi:1,2-dihydroxy-3-keto-5-methylthiopentene dioxygenase